ncbi:hypothetical protein [Streptomyces hydrogenans]|uniref:hypothetical protein n=1 Tax=Streptomyces hydrogenans TaxID=1873719 RepID=UPI0035E022D1
MYGTSACNSECFRAPVTPESPALLGAAGAAVAIAAVFGNPLVAVVFLIEVPGVGGAQLFVVMLSALLSSGAGVVVFTGFGHWNGLGRGDLSVRFSSARPRLDTGGVVWSILLAMGIGALTHLVIVRGRLIAAFMVSSVLVRTVVGAVAAGGCAALHAVVTGRTPVGVALSGQAALAVLAADLHAWSAGALLAVLLFKSAAYAPGLGSLRGGLVYPCSSWARWPECCAPRCPASGCYLWRPRGWPRRWPPPCGFRSATWS